MEPFSQRRTAFRRNLIGMAHVPKTMAASAPALSIPLEKRRGSDEDKELVRMAQSGAEAAFEELVRRHQQRVFALVSGILRRQEDVEDIAQQVFLKVYLSHETVRSARGFFDLAI